DDEVECINCSLSHPVQPIVGSCDARLFLAQDRPTSLYEVDTSTNPFSHSLVGSSSVNYNALAFNPADGYLYASGMIGGVRSLLRIGGDGSVVNMGEISGGGINGNTSELNT